MSKEARDPARARQEGAWDALLLVPPELCVSTVTLVESLTATVSVDPSESHADQLWEVLQVGVKAGPLGMRRCRGGGIQHALLVHLWIRIQFINIKMPF